MADTIHRCYIFSAEQENFLRSKRYKIDRMECFLSLVDRVQKESTLVEISNNRKVELHCGQFLANDVELSHLWHLDRKTCSKLMKQMAELGLFTVTKVAELSVYTMHVLSGWYVNGTFIKNGFYHRPQAPNSPSNCPIPTANTPL